MKQIAFTTAATRQFAKLPPAAQQQIEAKLDIYAATGHGDIKRLKGIDGLRLRAGDWRVIFTLEGDTILIHKVGNRREIYD